MGKVLEVIKPGPTDLYILGVTLEKKAIVLSDGQSVPITHLRETKPRSRVYSGMAGPDNRGRWCAFKASKNNG